MAAFKDALGQTWDVDFDAFVLDKIKSQVGIDLADLTAGGWYKIETDVISLVHTVAVIIREQLDARRIPEAELGRRIRKEAITRARESLKAAAADFFPESDWSAIRSNLNKRKQMQLPIEASSLKEIAPMMELMESFQRLDPEVQKMLIDAETGNEIARTKIQQLTDSESSENGGSVGGQESIPLTPAIDGLESVEFHQDVLRSDNFG